jgi:hypothetical protein
MPEMSIILVSPDTAFTIRKTIYFLRRQNVRDQLELVIVAPDRRNIVLDDDTMRDFALVTVVSSGPLKSVSEARAIGVRASHAPIVVFTEEHCFPEAGWAEMLLRSHLHPWAVVGPAVRNANPKSRTSRANVVIEYGAWLDPVPSGMVSHLPGHNSAYKRRILDTYEPRLHEWLDAETVLHWDLIANGHYLYLDASAKIRLWNFSKLTASIALRFYHGRLFASSRHRKWSISRRFAYFFSGPLIPFVRLCRILRALRRPERKHERVLPLIPLLLLLLGFDAFGEMIGYAFAMGNARERIRDMEFHRECFLNSHDRQFY